MGNSIALANKYLPILDEVYKANSKTAILDSTGIEFVGANAVKVFKTSLQGLGTYSRSAGYVNGDITGEWETLTLAQDRGRAFVVDSMDNEETLGMAFGTLIGQFLKQQVIPELDAYRIAKYATNAGNSANADLSSSSNVADLIATAEKVLGDKEVPEVGRVLFVSETAYMYLKGNITRKVDNMEKSVNKFIDYYDDMPVIKVPSGRFCTAITLYDGSQQGQTGGGYIKTSGSYDINFMIIHPSAVCQVVKHVLPKVISPEANQTADGWKFMYRIYHDCFVYANKADGIYLHRKATANS